MLTMKLCTDVRHVRELCDRQGLSFDGNIGAFISEERGKETGFCLFSIQDRVVTIRCVLCGEDYFLEDGLIRAVLSYCSHNGTSEFLLSSGIEWKMAKQLGLDIHLTDSPRNIEEFFAKYKNCAR